MIVNQRFQAHEERKLRAGSAKGFAVGAGEQLIGSGDKSNNNRLLNFSLRPFAGNPRFNDNGSDNNQANNNPKEDIEETKQPIKTGEGPCDG